MSVLGTLLGKGGNRVGPPPPELALDADSALSPGPPVFAPRRAVTSDEARLAQGRELPTNVRAPHMRHVMAPPPRDFARGREVAALLFWTLAVFVALAIASYAGDPTPPPLGPDGVPTSPPIHGDDWIGPVGASVARALVTLVGVLAWVVPIEALLLGIPFVRGKRSLVTPSRLAGNLLICVIGASLVQVAWPEKLVFGRHPGGGMVGELFGELARSLFSTAGSFLVGFALLGLILIGRASFSFIALMRWLAQVGRSFVRWTRATTQRVARAWKEARELERERAEAKRREEEPVIELRADGEATILASDDDDPPPILDADARSPEEPFAVESPLVVAEPTPAPAPTPAAPKKKTRKRAPAVAIDQDDLPADASVEIAAAADEDRDDDDAEPEPRALAVTPLEVADVAPKSKRARPKKATEITIVDTSAALAKDARPEGKKDKKAPAGFKLPSIDFLVPAETTVGPLFDEEKLRRSAELLVKTLSDYKVTGKVEEILPGPVVTTFEVSPVAGTKVSKVAALADDLALALAKKVRIVAPIPGKNRIGFELPNDKRHAVNLRDLVEDRRFQQLDVPLPVVLGRDIVGNPVYADLASMPHTIVAGATGAGKSVGLNVMLTSLLYRRTPEELRMLMIDPKVVELAPFDRIPHMLLPVVTDMKQASTALKWAVDEMERRYQLFADAGTKNIGTYNAWVKRVIAGEAKNPLGKAITGKDAHGFTDTLSVGFDDPEGEQQYPEPLPMIVIVVDEFADLMMQQGKEVEAAVARLAQKARAAGMHVILATQRPSVDVITGMIKANFPTRIAYRVAQKVDSRTILDEQGAEHLLGKGDMLIKLNGTNETRRVQCPWVSEEEVQLVTDHLRAQGEPVYDENILKPRDDEGGAAPEDDGEQDAMYDEAVRIVADTRRCSTSWLQRKLGLGYNRAARIVETMERRGLVGPANGAKDREVLIDPI